MFRFLRLGICILSIFALALLFACEGDQGPQGPPGDKGDPGEPGSGCGSAPPEDFYLSMAVFNGYDGVDMDYRAADFVKVTFDTEQEPGSDLIVGVFLEEPPTLDGEDGDIDEWGDGNDIYESRIALDETVGNDIGTGEVLVRCAYDAENVYFFFTWSEAGVTEENRNFEEWEITSTPEFTYTTVGSEDRLWILFPEDSDFEPSENDVLLADGLDNASLSVSGRVDVWDWRASLTDLVGFVDDAYIVFDGASHGGVQFDAGGGAFVRNIDGDHPAWMHFTDPNANVDYPLWFRDAIIFNTTNWGNGQTIPGYMATVPYGDRGDIYCASIFEMPRWIVEVQRSRSTGSGNDKQF